MNQNVHRIGTPERAVAKRRPALLATVAITAVGLLAAACSSSSAGANNPPGSAASGATTLSGSPIEITSIADITAPSLGFNYPQAVSGAQAAVAAVNADGGINGHPLKLTVCDGKGDPNVEQACARKVVASKSVATVGDSTFVTAMAPLLEPAGIAEIMDDPTQPTELQARNSFPENGNAFLGAFGMLHLAINTAHARKVSIIGLGPAAAPIYAALKKQAPLEGGQIVGTVTLQGNETDLTPAVQSAAAHGAQAIILLMPSDNAARVIASMKQNNISADSISIALNPDALKTLGSAANGAYELGFFPPMSSTVSGIVQFKKEMKAYQPSASMDTFSILPWLAVHMFADVAKTLPEVTRSSVLAAWSKATNIDGYGLLPPYTTTKPYTGTGGSFPRAFNNTFWYDQIKDGTPTLVVDHPVPVD